MKKIIFTILFAVFIFPMLQAQTSKLDSLFPVRGLSIESPRSETLDSFLVFVEQELVPRKLNTMILRVDFNYYFETHPELVDTVPLTKQEVKRIVALCKKNNIRLIPQINLLGHQSWAEHLGKLLEVYPQFDETPHVKIPEKYEWPNADGLYCKSYCPLHPDVHKVVFDLVDEICDVFEADAFHAGMDEVFYIGDDLCPRCQGRDKAELFAGEVRRIRDHLALKNRQLMIWGDRLLEGKETGLGMWEASYNNTHRAIDMIPKDVFICDWHYERPDKTAVIFANKGLTVATAPWRNPVVTTQQVKDMARFRMDATKQVRNNYAGIISTTWSPAIMLVREAYRSKADKNFRGMGQWASLVAMFDTMDELAK
ncbi:MAG: family 20 glycosylhydrolase [Chitinophagaceae bacterium]|nr:family 20 glycosylhydrolase [Chitinophagaceae bacterium]